MQQNFTWFHEVLSVSVSLYFQHECEYRSASEIPPPAGGWLEKVTETPVISSNERLIIMLALMPHISPQTLDVFFIQNRHLDRFYTEFGGWRGISHGGFLPTGETAAFLIAGDRMEQRKEVVHYFQNNHWFYTRNILHLEGAGSGEPFLSGQLHLSEEFLSRVLFDRDYKPDYSIGFPAKRITSGLDWEDMVLDYQVAKELEEINTWISSRHTIMEEWGLSRFLKAGYRSLFYGPPGTGKTLAATLIGKKNHMDVYRVDLSMIVSKYIGETEKNLARVFDLAENRNWILFFDEADALFGKRTSTNTSNDRHSNQEVAYLLQRIEDFPGTVILATNLRSNIDEAFSRRFQTTIYFPMPSKEMRAELWKKMLPTGWLGEEGGELIEIASDTELSGGAITNVVRRCALYLVASREKHLSQGILKEALHKEKMNS